MGPLYALLILSILGALPFHTYASDTLLPERFDNLNWQVTEQPLVAYFSAGADGTAHGVTEDGIPFTQYTVYEENDIRIQRFEIEDHYHYIVDGQVAFSLEALSTLLARHHAMNL